MEELLKWGLCIYVINPAWVRVPTPAESRKSLPEYPCSIIIYGLCSAHVQEN